MMVPVRVLVRVMIDAMFASFSPSPIPSTTVFGKNPRFATEWHQTKCPVCGGIVPVMGIHLYNPTQCPGCWTRWIPEAADMIHSTVKVPDAYL